MNRLVIVVPLVACALVYACSDDPSRPPVTSSSGAPGVATPTTGSSAASSGNTGASTTSSSSTSSSSSSSGTTTSSSGSAGAGGTSSGGTDGAAPDPSCQGVPREGTNVAETAIAAAPPTPTGGNVGSGKYYLTLWESYTGAGGAQGATGEVRRTTLVVTGTKLQFATTDVEQAIDLPIAAEEAQTQGSTLTSNELCPLAGRARTRGFSASPTEIELFETVANTTRRFVYTKQ